MADCPRVYANARLLNPLPDSLLILPELVYQCPFDPGPVSLPPLCSSPIVAYLGNCIVSTASMSTTMTKVLRDPGATEPNSVTLVNAIRTQQGIPLPPPRSTATTVLNKDKDTPDSHVRRDGRLIRLTGVHPFNAESPLTPLYNEGMPCHVPKACMDWELTV